MSDLDCLTYHGEPFFQLFGSQLPCSGHGTCMNVSSTQSLCLCDPGWSGASDLFDLRILTVNGTVYALDCPMNFVAEKFFWSLLFFAIFVRWAFPTFMLFAPFTNYSWPRYKSGQRKDIVTVIGEYIARSDEYKIKLTLIMDVFIGNPLTIVVPILKLFTNQVIGTDVAVTVILGVSVATLMAIHTVFNFQQFKAIVFARVPNREEARKIYTFYKVLRFSSLFMYSCVVSIPTFCALATDKSLGPYLSFEFVTLLLRNIGVVLWLIFDICAARLMSKQVEELVRTFARTNIDSGAGRVIAYLNEEAKRLQKQCAFPLVLYATFSLPWFWSIQGYQIAFSMSVATIASNIGLVLFRSKKSAQSKTLRSSDLSSKPNQELPPSGEVPASVGTDRLPSVPVSAASAAVAQASD